jgi:hypothetical protein
LPKQPVVANITVTQFELALHAARTVDECWQALLDTSRILGFSAATLRLADRHLTATLAGDAPAECWSLTIPLDGAGHVDLSIPYRPGQPCATIGPLATSLRTVLAPKLHSNPTPSPKPKP